MLGNHHACIILWVLGVDKLRACLAGNIMVGVCWWRMRIVEMYVGGDVRLLLFLFILKLLVVLLLTILLLLHFLPALMNIEVLVFIVVIRNGALSSIGIKSENLSPHLEG